jgi:cytochrome c oxidase assembly factor CtaG/putative copper export protein
VSTTVTSLRAPTRLIGLAFIVLALSALAVSLVITEGAYSAPAPGIPDPGALVGWGTPILRLLTTIAGITTIGWLLAAAIIDPAGSQGVLSPTGRRDVIRAAWSAGTWAVLAIAQMIFTLASALALPLSTAASAGVVTTYANELAPTRALLVMAILAILITAAAITMSTTGSAITWLIVALVAAMLPPIAGHSSGLGDHALATTSGAAHAVAATVWIGGLFALAIHAVRGMPHFAESVRRFSGIAITAFVLLGASGLANGYTRLEYPAQLITTGYGQLLIVKVVLLAGLAGIAWVMRDAIARNANVSLRARFARIAGIELLVMMMAVGIGVALASSPYPRIEIPLPTYGETLLGFAYPPAPTIPAVVFGFQLEPFFLVMSLIAASLYAVGLIRLRQRGHHWPVGRSISWFLGIGVVIWCTNAGIATYAQVSVSLHMVQHMTLTMLAPIMLVLGAPATLALRALRPSKSHQRGPREWLVWFLHSWITRILTNPFYVFFIYVIGLYGLYLTPAFGWLMGSHIGHLVMQSHFIIAGYLFYWVLIGIDPRPKPMPYWSRLLMLLLALAVHGFFAVALMMATTPLAPEWYGIVRPEWVTDPLADSLVGGQIAWGLSEIPTVIVLIVIAVQWARSDQRESVRRDRAVDRDGDSELDAYNAHLARMAAQDQARGSSRA